METPLEAVVRMHFRRKIEPLIGRSRYLDVEGAERLIEHKVAEVLPILRESLADDASPTEDDLFRASMEASHRTIGQCVVQMRSSTTQDPRRRAILNALADDAEQNLAAFRTIGPDVTEGRLAEMTEGVIERQRQLHQRFFPDAGGTPTPQ